MPNKQFFLAVAIVVATIVGGGIFALPYAFAKAGLWPSLAIFALLLVINIYVMLMYGEVVLRTKGTRHQATGYAGFYLGKPGRAVMLGVLILGNFGALLIYTLGVGDFLSGLFAQGFFAWEQSWGLIFYAVASLLVILGLKIIARVDLIICLLFVVIVLVVVFTALPHVDLGYFNKVDMSRILFPFGIIIFSLSGLSAVPFLDDLFPNQRRRMKGAIIWGLIATAIITLAFALVVFGMDGQAVSGDSLLTIQKYLPAYVSFLMGIFGIIAMGTSFLTTGLVMREMFEYDYKVPKLWSLLLVVGIPLVLFLMNIAGFVDAIGFVGSVTGGLSAILIIMMYRRARISGQKEPEYKVKVPKPMLGLIIVVYILAIGYEIYSLFS